MPPVSKQVPTYYCFCYLYYDRYKHNITVSATSITTGTHILLLTLIIVSRQVQSDYNVSATCMKTGTHILLFLLRVTLQVHK